MSAILQANFISRTLKGRVYDCCVRRCKLYASETWPVTQRNLDRLVKTERKMIRYMCGVSWKDKISSEELLREVGLEAIDVIIGRNRLRWYGHVVRKDEEDWVKRCMNLEVMGKRERGRPKKTWRDNVERDMKKLGLTENDARDRPSWRRGIGAKADIIRLKGL